MKDKIKEENKYCIRRDLKLVSVQLRNGKYSQAIETCYSVIHYLNKLGDDEEQQKSKETISFSKKYKKELKEILE